MSRVMRYVIRGCAVASVLLILLLTLSPHGSRRHVLHLRPFSDIVPMLRHGNRQTDVVQIGGNIGLYMPLGFFLPLAVPSLRSTWRIALLAAALSASVETLQYFLPLGRYASTDDVLLNTAGSVLGYVTLRMLMMVFSVVRRMG